MIFEKRKLEDLCISITDGDHQTIPLADEGIPFIIISDIKNNRIDFRNARHVPNDYFEKVDVKRRPQFGDVLYTVKGSFGIPVYVDTEQPFVFQRDVAILKCNEAIDSLYLFYYMSNEAFYKYADSIAIGAAQRAITLKMLRNTEVLIPSLDDQHRIANVLSSYDALISNNQKQIKLLEESAKRLYKEWFVDWRFPGYDDIEAVDGVPSGWEETGILDNNIFCLAKSRLKPFDGEKEYYATADVTGTYVTTKGELITYDSKPSRAQFAPTLYSVWFARMSNSYKIVGFTSANSNRLDKTALSSGFCGFEATPETWGYVYCTIASEQFDLEKNRYATGATQVSLTNEGLKKIKVLIPTQEILKQFGEFVNPIIDKVISLYEYNFALQEARNRLLPKLMSGEIEV